MNFYRSVILPALLLMYSLSCSAQDNNYVYKDTALLYQDSVTAAVKAQSEIGKEPASADDKESSLPNGYIADTVLRDNLLFVEPDSVKTLKRSNAFKYARNLDSLLKQYKMRIKEEKPAKRGNISWLGRILISPVTKYFFWTLAVFFVLFILFRLFFTQGFFQRSYASTRAVEVPGEADHTPLSADFSKLIAQAAANGNFRAAVRYHYLQSLQKLSSKGAIKFAPDKTNYQYLRELSGKKYKDGFAALTRNYEYVWYGEFEVSENSFQAIQDNFRQFNSEV